MTRQKWYAIVFVGVVATLLNLANGVYLLLAAKRHDAQYILAILTLVMLSLLSICNMVALVFRVSHQVVYCRGLLLILGPPSLVLVGTIPSMALLDSTRPSFGDNLCSLARERCLLSRDGAILLAFLLWVAAALTQTMFTVLYSSRYNSKSTEIPSSHSTHPASPMQPVTPGGLSCRTQVRRIPMMRQDTSDEPFSYEAALQAKAAVQPPNHQSSHSDSSHQSNMTFVKTHMTNASHSRSWASTLPTAVSEFSPRSFYGGQKHSARGSDDQSANLSRRNSPVKSEWSAWGLAVGSPRHKVQQENTSVSTTSTGRTRPAKSLKNFRFHLPNSPENANSTSVIGMDRSPEQRADLDGSPAIRTLNPLGLEGIDALSRSRSTSSPRLRRKSPNKGDSQVTLFPPHRSATTIGDLTGSPERRRASFLEALKPRLSHSKSLSRNSWMARSATSSPTKSHAGRSSMHTPQDSPTEDAFAQWDTTNVESDPAYLVSMKDSRDISGSSPYPQMLSLGDDDDDDDDRGDTESLWGNRSVRVASDGSVIARDRAQKHMIHRLSRKLSLLESIT